MTLMTTFGSGAGVVAAERPLVGGRTPSGTPVPVPALPEVAELEDELELVPEVVAVEVPVDSPPAPDDDVLEDDVAVDEEEDEEEDEEDEVSGA